MPTMVGRLLDLADGLLQSGARSSAARRRAVSTAYYAVFHALAKVCTDGLLPATRRDSDEYARVYRSLDHGSLKSAFRSVPLVDRDIFRNLGDLIVRLQSERHRADYSPPVQNVFTVEQAERLIAQAREAVSGIEALDAADRRTLVCLLFKARP